MAQSALPGIFTYSNTSQGIMQNQDFRLNGPAATPRGGTAVIVYLTGIGLVDNTIAPGAVTPNSPYRALWPALRLPLAAARQRCSLLAIPQAPLAWPK